MDRDEAQKLLALQMEEFKKKSYTELVNLLGDVWAEQVKGPSSNSYTIEIEVFWDYKPNGDVRVLGSIDDGGLRTAFRPLCSDYLVTPAGKILD